MEIKLPKSSTGGDHDKTPISIVPEGLSTDAYNKIYADILNKIVEKEEELEERILKTEGRIDEYKKEIEKQAFRNIEIIGVFSAVLALLIIDVSIIKSATSFLSAILLISSLATVVAFFVMMIHILFAPEDRAKLTAKRVWIPITILVVFVILGIVAELSKWPWSRWIGTGS